MTQPPMSSGVIDLGALRKPSRPTAAPAAPANGRGAIVDVTDATFATLLEQSRTVPVVVDLWADWCQPCKTLTPILEKLAAEFSGRFVLAKVDVDANPQIAQAFNVQSIPHVLALIGGQPYTLFHGAHPEPQVRQIVEEMLQISAQQGVTGTVDVGPAATAEPEAPALPPHHAAGLDAIEAGDWDAAEEAYQAALKENPRDAEARAALLQVAWMRRIEDLDPAAAIAGAREGDLESQLRAADAELAGGQLSSAFGRLLRIVRSGGDDREPARVRLLEYFDVIGSAPEVAEARRELASSLY